MFNRFEITPTHIGANFKAVSDGHGATGQVKEGGWLGRNVIVQEHELNAGSLIDFLNTKLSADEQLKKRSFFGLLGGSSDKEIQAVFDKAFPNVLKNSFLQMDDNKFFTEAWQNKTAENWQKKYGDEGYPAPDRHVLFDNSRDRVDLIYYYDPVMERSYQLLYIHISDKERPEEGRIDGLLTKAMAVIAEKDYKHPTDFNCEGGYYDSEDWNEFVREWQLRNGRGEEFDVI